MHTVNRVSSSLFSVATSRLWSLQVAATHGRSGCRLGKEKRSAASHKTPGLFGLSPHTFSQHTDLVTCDWTNPNDSNQLVSPGVRDCGLCSLGTQQMDAPLVCFSRISNRKRDVIPCDHVPGAADITSVLRPVSLAEECCTCRGGGTTKLPIGSDSVGPPDPAKLSFQLTHEYDCHLQRPPHPSSFSRFMW